MSREPTLLTIEFCKEATITMHVLTIQQETVIPTTIRLIVIATMVPSHTLISFQMSVFKEGAL